MTAGRSAIRCTRIAAIALVRAATDGSCTAVWPRATPLGARSRATMFAIRMRPSLASLIGSWTSAPCAWIGGVGSALGRLSARRIPRRPLSSRAIAFGLRSGRTLTMRRSLRQLRGGLAIGRCRRTLGRVSVLAGARCCGRFAVGRLFATATATATLLGCLSVDGLRIVGCVALVAVLSLVAVLVVCVVGIASSFVCARAFAS